MRTAFPVQELPARNALTVGLSCVNRTRKHAASVTAYSVLRACPSIKRSTRSQSQSLPQRIEFGNEKELNWQVRLIRLTIKLTSISLSGCSKSLFKDQLTYWHSYRQPYLQRAMI